MDILSIPKFNREEKVEVPNQILMTLCDNYIIIPVPEARKALKNKKLSKSGIMLERDLVEKLFRISQTPASAVRDKKTVDRPDHNLNRGISKEDNHSLNLIYSSLEENILRL